MVKRRTLRAGRHQNEFWQSCRQRLEEEAEGKRPLSSRDIVECIRHGFVSRRRHPMHMWPEVEQEIYEDYMTTELEPAEEGEETTT